MPVYAQYYFWLIAVSLLCFVLERIRPWRPQQKVLRRAIGQDLVWLIFNGHYLGVILAIGTGRLVHALNAWLRGHQLPVPETLALAADMPLWAQFAVFFVLKDFVEWNIHRMLHIVPWMWEFHKLHHSIEELDWIGNFRFHWGEVVIYKTLSYLPLVILGVDDRVVLIIAVIGTLLQDLNHSNLPIDWGPFRYLLNSAKMHIWHHDVDMHGRGGQNFGIVLSVWDWIFGTVYWPADSDGPARLGFRDMETTYPAGLLARFVYPFRRRRKRG